MLKMLGKLSPANWLSKNNAPKHTVQEDIVLLARYAVETRHRPEVLDEATQFLVKVDSETLTPEDVERMAKHLKLLLPDNKDVTPETLRATAGFEGHVSNTVRYLRVLWLLTFALVVTRLAIAVMRNSFGMFEVDVADPDSLRLELYALMITDNFEPFLYGLLGSCVYLMRITGHHLRERTFDPRRIAEHMNRLFLGGVSGGVIVLVIDNPGDIKLSAAALGFLAGYSIEFLFRTVDRLIEAILPKAGMETIARERSGWRKRVEFEIETVERQLAAITDPSQKKVAEETLGRLKGLLKT
ncbi:MAG: hypothetical protein KY410_06420 [Proteobacteria bacterium]|nr:hypothetical protein [Pseudomonadota bacterium]